MNLNSDNIFVGREMLEIKKECTGCMACVNSCPVSAIQITEDKYGFLMPEIIQDKCINCDMCLRVCPIENVPGSPDKSRENISVPLEAWSMYHKSEEVVSISSSGGAFYGLAEKVLEREGIVFGCFYDIIQKKAYLTDTNHVSLQDLLTSKYVESAVGEGGFQKIEKELKRGREVLFCGTPCEAAGLRKYLSRNDTGRGVDNGSIEGDYENLLIVDFACGGVAAQPYLSAYLTSLEEKYESKISDMSFRDKHYGWGQYCFTARFENGEIYRKTAMSDPYFFCFLRSSMQRLSCHGCIFANDHRSDICLSDFWKCDFFDIDRNDRKGLSLALAFSEKGKRKIQELKDLMNMQSIPVKDASYHLKGRFCPPEKLEEIYRDMTTAYVEGVEVLRNRLLTEEQKDYYDRRQQIMDDEGEIKKHPEIVGNGQIMSKS